MIRVNRGVNELRIPASELSIPVWAFAKRNAGKPLPIKPTRARYFHSLHFNLRILATANGLSARKVIEILSAPTSVLEKNSSPRLIRIKELPQISARPASMLQAIIRLREEALLLIILFFLPYLPQVGFFSPAKLEKEIPIILIDFELLTIRYKNQA
jgi:hypothetical protein